MGLRRDPHPPNPIVMPGRSSPTTSSRVVRLSGTRSSVHRDTHRARCRAYASLLDEGGPLFVGDARDVQLVGEALLEPVAALHVDGVDAVQRLLGPPDDGGALGRDGVGHLVGGVDELVALAPPRGPSRSGAARPPSPAWRCRPSPASCAGGRAGPDAWRRRALPGRPRAGRRWRRRRPRRRRRCPPARCRHRGRTRARRRSPEPRSRRRRRRRRRIPGSRPTRASSPLAWISLMSTPAQNPRPSARSTTTRISGSRPAAIERVGQREPAGHVQGVDRRDVDHDLGRARPGSDGQDAHGGSVCLAI